MTDVPATRLVLLAHLAGILVTCSGLFDSISNRFLRYSLQSRPTPGHDCPVTMVSLKEKSGCFARADELSALREIVGGRRLVLFDFPKSKVKGEIADKGFIFREPGVAASARSDELVMFAPNPEPAHVKRLLEMKGLRRPPCSYWPIFERRRLLDASLLDWEDVLSFDELLEGGSDGNHLNDVIVAGDMNNVEQGVMTLCHKVSPSALTALLVICALSGRELMAFSVPSQAFVYVFVALAIGLVHRAWRRSVSVPAAAVLMIASGAFCRKLLVLSGLWLNPACIFAASFASIIAPVDPAALSLQGKGGTDAPRPWLSAARRYWRRDEDNFSKAVAGLEKSADPCAAVWRLISEQEKLMEEKALSLGALELHTLPVEELYCLGKVYEEGFHWNEALLAYDWAAVRNMSYKDLAARRAEVKEAVLGNLEFVDIDELVEGVDKRYRDLSILGQGGMGVVMKARDSYLERPVAVKLVLPSSVSDEIGRERFLRESETLSRLNHPLVVQIYTVHKADNLFYYTMELLEGKDLRAAIGSDSGCTVTEKLKVLSELAGALAYVHDQGVLHRDLKPDNVLMVAGRGPVLIDFGIARAVEHAQGLTRAGQMVGTLAYMAPELVRGRGGGRASDIFAFGVICYEIFTGRLPFTNPVRLKAKPPKPPSAHNSEIRQPLEDLILKLMSYAPEDRPADFSRVRAALDGLFHIFSNQ